jgi:hypothetical protein
MIFLARDEVEKRRENLQRKLLSNPRPVFYFQSNPANDFAGAARAFVASFGGFREATLMCVSFPLGDGWHETQLADSRWARFRRWRESHGEARRLFDVPGQQFDADETEPLAEAVAFALLLGWEAWLDGNLGRKLITFSHDDRVEVHRGVEKRELSETLLKLGFWQLAGAK